MTNTSVIAVKGLTKKYAGVAAVDNVDFTITKGEIVGFVGLNGAGKSTAINILLGFLNPTAGKVSLFGEPLTPQNAHNSHHRIGFATGDMSLFDSMTGHQYHSFIARAYGLTDMTAYKALCLRFDPDLDKKISLLSRGNKQKIALIAAFMTQPELVILDEPSSGLDPLMQQYFLELIREETEKGTTIFMSSHYLNEVIDVCSRILLIKKGRLTKDIPTSELGMAAGKLVRVITTRQVEPPKSARSVERQKQADGYILEFIYKDKVIRLQEWVTSLPNLQDIAITEHDPEATFEDLYNEKANNDV
ncbi:MAG TPA: ABC transporter ATP-binding protein [Candidatus Microsaccharimonas sp.]|jgi:ABC-2 type transport system ATP-binding protein